MIKQIDELMYEAIENGVFPGANLCIIANGKTEIKSYGLKAKYPKEEENGLDTLYDMASLTKVVATTTCIMILLERGKLRLYDSVSSYLSDFVHKDITIWDLLTHSSGLPADVKNSHYLTKEEIYKSIMTVELAYPTSTQIKYSDLGFILLGWIIEKITNEDLDTFSKNNLFIPLEMFDSSYKPSDVTRCAPTEDRGEYIDRGYVHDEKAHHLDDVAGHAGLFCTISDISHFLQMILNDGVYNKKRILSKQSIDLLFTPQVKEIKGVLLTSEVRGLGWIVKGSYPCSGDLASSNTIMHTGFTGTSIAIDRDNMVAVCLLSNRVHPTRQNNKIIPFRAKLGNYIFSHIESL